MIRDAARLAGMTLALVVALPLIAIAAVFDDYFYGSPSEESLDDSYDI